MNFCAIRIRGYAAVFEQVIEFAGAREYVARDAFADFLRSGAAVAINFGEHDRPYLGKATLLFADDYGLGFEATLDCSAPECMGVPRSICRGVDFASVNLGSFDRPAVNLGGEWIYRISAATIDHVTLTSCAAYAGTAVWLADVPVDDAPPRIRSASARWETGYVAWRRARSVVAPRPRSERDASAMLASRRAEFAQFRGAVISALWHGQYPDGAILCHAAFTRKGGMQPPAR
jgi:phage head maturation protease